MLPTFSPTRLPFLLVLVLAALALLWGPIVQPQDYHHFADISRLASIPHAADVLSNAGFALVGLWGLLALRQRRCHPLLAPAWAGYRLFLVALILTAAGSAWYHWQPDDARLIWDRLPIALACAGLLAAVRADQYPDAGSGTASLGLAVYAVLGVAWWYWQGDLRPYLLLQLLPLLLIPLWQRLGKAEPAERHAFGLAILLYVVAKLAELGDHALYHQLGFVTGHTLKHWLATAAAAVIVARLLWRTRSGPSTARMSTQTGLAGES
jgi:hypothetical protein